MMLGLQRNQDLRIGSADCSAIAVRKIDSAGRQANIVEDAGEFRRWYLLANDAFNLVVEASGIFDSSAGLCSRVEPNLAGVDRREEVLAKQWNKSEARHAKDQE